jgi:hypothetical protein
MKDVYELNAQNLQGTYVLHENIKMAFEGGARVVLLPATACGTNKVSRTELDRIFLVYFCYRRYMVE